jgi:DNA-binding IclR family transcriptional regulator
VPIPSKSGRIEVALNASAEGRRASKEDLVERFLPVLWRAADQLAHAF